MRGKLLQSYAKCLKRDYLPWLVQIDMTDIFIVGVWSDKAEEFRVVGVYDNEEKASEACDDGSRSYAKMEINKTFAKQDIIWHDPDLGQSIG